MAVVACNFLIWMLFPLFFCGVTAQIGTRPPWTDVSRSHTHTHTHTYKHTHPIGLLWKSDQIVPKAATFTTQQTQGTNIHAPGGIQTHYPKNPTATHLRFRPHRYRHRLLFCFSSYIMWQWPQAIYIYGEMSPAGWFWISGPSKTVFFGCTRLLHKFECFERCTHWRLLK